ncbi:MAG: zf-HC2 domain-containing protein [bacterium]
MNRRKVRNARSTRKDRGHHECKSHHNGNCRGLLPYITDFLEGEAGKDICQRISRHLVRCERCRMYIDAHAGVIQLFKTWRDDPMPRSAKVKLRQRIDEVIAGASLR